MPKLTLITSTMATMVLDTPATMVTLTATGMATTDIHMHTGDVRRERPHPQQQQRQILTMDIMATATDIIRTMATGEGRRGPQKPFLIPSQLLTQTLRLMLTMAIMATLGPTTMVTTGAKVITSRLLELDNTENCHHS